MDSNRFDDLTRRMTSVRFTRMHALRGLAVGSVAAIAGVSHSPDDVDAKKGKKAICQCTGTAVANCFDKKAKKKAKKKIFKANPCSYTGKCRGFNPCSPAPTGTNTNTNTTTFVPAGSSPISPDLLDLDPVINIVCPNGQADCPSTASCVSISALGLNVCLEVCGTGDPCTAGSTCVLGVCLPLDIGGACTTGADCDTGFCNALGLCGICDVVSVCGTVSNPICCVVGAECLNNTCVIRTN